MIDISSKHNEYIKDLAKLNQSKYRKLTGQYLIEGEHLVVEAFKAGMLLEFLKLESESLRMDVKTTSVSQEVIAYLSNLVTPPKVIGVCKVSDIVDISGNVLVVDGVRDPGNFGAMIRNAVAFNINTIIMSEDSVDIYNDKVLRASQGQHFHINVIRGNLVELIGDLKAKAYTIYSTNVEGGTNLKDIKPANPFAVVIGNEGSGISKEVNDLCNQAIYIKINAKCESLNAAVASGIILYELNKE